MFCDILYVTTYKSQQFVTDDNNNSCVHTHANKTHNNVILRVVLIINHTCLNMYVQPKFPLGFDCIINRHIDERFILKTVIINLQKQSVYRRKSI